MTGIDPKDALLFALVLFSVFYVVVVFARIAKGMKSGEYSLGDLLTRRGWSLTAIGFVTNFFDTLGVGSFATTTAAFRRWKLVPDERIPGTLNVGHTIPTIAQAFIFTKLVPVEPMTLVLMILAAVSGSWIGSGIVAGWPRRRVQLGMGIALTGFGILMICSVMGWLPGGGTLLKLEGGRLAMGLIGNFALGSLMTLGIGLYAPCMVLIYLLGMDPQAAFPIMMGSCAFLMPIASYRFIKAGGFDLRAIVGLMLGGLPAVLLAAFVFSSLKVEWLKALVVIVIFYAAYGLLSTARREKAAS